jgi:cellobiose phosphorylase
VRPDWDGLRIAPVIPSRWQAFDVVRRFRGSVYHIHVTNPGKVERGVARIRMEGEDVDPTATLPLAREGSEVRVEVEMG